MTGRNGRHPLPAEETLAELFSSWGINPDVQVVAYDARGGGFAARLWWSLRYLGHEKAAILDGGYPAWESAGFVTEVGDQARPRREFQPHPRPEMLVTSPELRELLEQPGLLVIDSRAPERYRGEEEPYDPVAGHVPGAANHFWQSNLTPDGSLLTKEELHRRFTALLGNIPPEKSIFYCGSGVTACHNLLAMSHAGLPTPRLYAGSWSEWCADPQNPVATGGSASRTSEQTEAHT
jgi:thiosulfate/3-mercaptopyruvate sulfurtransferase